MNRRRTAGFAALVAVLCLGLVLGEPDSVVGLLAQPFETIGKGLRTLSLSGETGNLAAIALYMAVCLSPVLLIRKEQRGREDFLLLCCSGLLFYVMNQMVNPHRIMPMMEGGAGKMILGGSVYSVLLAWGVLKLLNGKKSAGQRSMYRALEIFLMILAAECFVMAFGVGAMELKGDLLQIRESNTMPGLNLIPTYMVRFGLFAASALEYSLDGFVMLYGAKLMKALEKDPYSEECVAAAEGINGLCTKALGWIMLSNMAMNVIQAIWMNQLYHIDVSVRIPVMSMAVVFGAMALSRLLVQGKEIKDDNDLFV